MNDTKYQITFDANKKHEIIIEEYKPDTRYYTKSITIRFDNKKE